MTIIIEDKKPRKIELTPLEIEIIKNALYGEQFGLVEYYGDLHKKLIKKLDRALEKNVNK